MAMTSKQDILQAIRGAEAEPAEPPPLGNDWLTFDDRPTKFAEMVEAVGGRCVLVAGDEELREQLASLAEFAEAAKICSLVPAVPSKNVDWADVDDPHELEDVDFAVLAGQFGVAENGAVWLTDDNLKHRVLFFIPQHLAVVVPADQLVDNMHKAYERVKLGSGRFGLFMSGPSKTADIEQSLVIGAHGARSLTVFLKG